MIGWANIYCPFWCYFKKNPLPSFGPALADYPGLLYDLERDPSESYSFTREHPAVAGRMAAALHRARQTVADGGVGAVPRELEGVSQYARWSSLHATTRRASGAGPATGHVPGHRQSPDHEEL